MDSSSRMPISSVKRSMQGRYNKAELCKRFMRGKCDYGGNCKFAHDDGTNRSGEKLRSNSDDFLGPEGHVKKCSENLCRCFIDGRCPYGTDRTFPHSKTGNVVETLPMHRQNDAITLVNDTQSGVNRRRSDEYYRGFKNLSCDAEQIQHKKPVGKTRLCCNWERTGTCWYGFNCKFAHGEAELQKLEESGKALNVETLTNAAKSPEPSKKGYKIAYEQLGNGKKRLIWWDNVEQVNGIYADWIDP